MTDRPIIFSAPMIRAILEGRKTQTRRILKPQPEQRNGAWYWQHPKYDNGGGADYFHTVHLSPLLEQKMVVASPYAVGDRLWVREAFTLTQHNLPVYRADGVDQRGNRWSSITPGDPEKEVKWKPSIHMPRWASRLTLTVTAVKVERLNDISEEDARAEGIFYQEPTAEDREWFKAWQEENFRDPNEPMDGIWTSGAKDTWGPTPQSAFMMLWRSIHGPDAWAANPFVAAITFTVEKA